MSIRALRTLIAVHKHGSFRAAAEAENITPAAVSQQMRNLERSWNLELFERKQRSPKLTITGLALVGEAQPVVSAYDSLAQKVGAGTNVAGELVLGAVPTTLTGLIPLALSRLQISHPEIRVRVVPGLSNQLLLQIDRNEVQAAVISKPEVLPNYMDFTEIAVEKMVLLVARDTPEAQPSEILRTHPFIRFNRDAVVGRQIEDWLRRNDIIVSDAMELDGLEAISSLVAANLGVSIVPLRCVKEHENLPLKRIPLGQDSPRRVLGLAKRKDAPQTNVINAAQAAMLEAVSIGVFSVEPARQ